MSKASPQDRLKSVELRQRQLQEKVNAAMGGLKRRRPEFDGKSTDEIRKIVSKDLPSVAPRQPLKEQFHQSIASRTYKPAEPASKRDWPSVEEFTWPARKFTTAIEAKPVKQTETRREDLPATTPSVAEPRDHPFEITDKRDPIPEIKALDLPIPEIKAPDLPAAPSVPDRSSTVESIAKAVVEKRAPKPIETTARPNGDAVVAAAQASISRQEPAVTAKPEVDEDRERMRALFRKIKVRIRRQT
jgi:hypothetical protein